MVKIIIGLVKKIQEVKKNKMFVKYMSQHVRLHIPNQDKKKRLEEINI